MRGSDMENEAKTKTPPKILIVDDISINVGILENIINEEGYEALCALSVQEALEIMDETMPDLILSDYSMPGMNGLEFCRLLKSNPRTRKIPFIFITVADSREDKKAAFMAGAVDFIPKPFEPVEVIMRVNNQLNSFRIRQEMEDYNRMMHKMVSEQKKHMDKERQSILLALAGVIEKRNVHGARDMERVGVNCHILAQSLQLVPEYEAQITDEFVETIGTAARLHDIGWIAVPDGLTADGNISEDGIKEFQARHTAEGAQILREISEGGIDSHFLDMAIVIAEYHHAKWDGTGVPAGLAGSAIPLAARITALVNDFDLLLGKNYADGRNPVEESVRAINAAGGSFYDPGIVRVFNKVLKRLRTE
ncbi:MAG: response regulator [Butyrivibrio sp.]|nr:response regulator [Butyrivibrio sp.]